MEKSALISYLDSLLSSQDVTTGKPDPEIYFLAMHRLGLRPEQCLVVEDNENGKQAAKASGAWLMEVNEVDEVNYTNIMRTIKRIEEHSA